MLQNIFAQSTLKKKTVRRLKDLPLQLQLYQAQSNAEQAKQEYANEIIVDADSALFFKGTFVDRSPFQTHEAALHAFDQFFKILASRWRLNSAIGYIYRIETKLSHFTRFEVRPIIHAVLFSNAFLDEAIRELWVLQFGNCWTTQVTDQNIKLLSLLGTRPEMRFGKRFLETDSEVSWGVSSNLWLFTNTEPKNKHQRRVLKNHLNGRPRLRQTVKRSAPIQCSHDELFPKQLREVQGADLYCNKLKRSLDKEAEEREQEETFAL